MELGEIIIDWATEKNERFKCSVGKILKTLEKLTTCRLELVLKPATTFKRDERFKGLAIAFLCFRIFVDAFSLNISH